MKATSVDELLSQELHTVWYVSYASNLCWERFRRYIEGGRFKNTRKHLPGCTDKTPPAESRGVVLPCRMYFGDHSATWDGGVAFLSPEEPGMTSARAYLVTLEQFIQITIQESNVVFKPGQVIEPLTGTGRYDRMVHCGDLDGLPMLTCTTPRPLKATAPTPDYLRTIADGLVQSHGLGLEEIAGYLSNLDGVNNYHTVDEIRLILGDDVPQGAGASLSAAMS